MYISTTSFSLTSLNVVVSFHKVYNTPPANVLIGLNLLLQVFFVDLTDEEVFTLPIFSVTSELVEKLVC